MVSVVIRRTDEPKVIQMTQSDLVRQLNDVQGAEIILEDTWSEGLKKVRTPYVSLIEPDCVFSAHYYSSNVGLIKKAHEKNAVHYKGGGGYQRLAMITSSLGVRDFGNRIFNFELDKISEGEVNNVKLKGWHVVPTRERLSTALYHIQVGFVPGAIIRMSAIKDIIEDELWDGDDLVKLSTALSFYLWDTGRRIQVNPNTTYVSSDQNLERPPLFEVNLPDKVKNIFSKEDMGIFHD